MIPNIATITPVEARKARLAKAMRESRKKTLRLLADIPDAHLSLRVHDFYSPIGWHFGHIGMTEEFWVMGEALKQSPRNPAYSFLFANLPENPKDNRVYLPSRKEIVAYLAATRRETLAALETASITANDPLLADAYAWDFAHQHECQHQETIAELRQLLAMHARLGEKALCAEQAEYVLRDPQPMEMVNVPGDTFLMGSDDYCVYDNEKPAHSVTVAPFALDKTPVTSGQWVQFIQDGGYQRPELWSEVGWQWRSAENADAPEYWQPVGKGWGAYRANGLTPISPHEPVTSLSWYEAEAYARWIGKRLPTEAEWEYAARYDPLSGKTRKYSWGNPRPYLHRGDFGLMRPDPYPLATPGQSTKDSMYVSSAVGAQYMAGSVWEWTASPFLPYPGFAAYPYDGYSKDHMDGKHYVCKGGSWATDARILRSSFRNWYVPTYRQGFLGMRCARSL